MGKRIAVVDGSNRGYDPIVIVDAALHHEVDDADQLEVLIRDQTIRQAPAGTDADRFILLTADEQDAVVISNDTRTESMQLCLGPAGTRQVAAPRGNRRGAAEDRPPVQ